MAALFARFENAYTGEKYYNFLRGDEQPMIAEAFSDAAFARLQALKRRHGPNNAFRLNLNVRR